jgi:hypothetical protein
MRGRRAASRRRAWRWPVALRELSDGAGIPSTSVAALLRRLRLGAEPLPRGSVLVIDEAGMLASRQLAELLRHTTAAGAKLVLTGDHRQLPELEAGGCFRGLAIRLPFIGLRDNRRQHAPGEQAALRELRHGDVELALAEYQRQERIVVATDAARLGERLVADWWSSGGPDAGIMIALRRTDVRALNRLARDAMRAAGRLRGDELVYGDVGISAGDVVVLRLNARSGSAMRARSSGSPRPRCCTTADRPRGRRQACRDAASRPASVKLQRPSASCSASPWRPSPCRPRVRRRRQSRRGDSARRRFLSLLQVGALQQAANDERRGGAQGIGEGS